MYIEVKGLSEIDSQDEFEYHSAIVKTFISLLEDELDLYNSRFPHKTLVFSYDPRKQKFKELNIPSDCKITFNKVKELSYKLQKYW